MNILGVQRSSFYVCFTAEGGRDSTAGEHIAAVGRSGESTRERSARFDTARIGPCRTLGRALIRPPALDIGQAATFSQREKDDRSRAHRGGHDSAGSDGSRVPGGACRSSREVVLDVHSSVGLVPSPAGRGRGLSRPGGWPRVRAWTCTASASARGGPLGVRYGTPERSGRFDTARIEPCRTVRDSAGQGRPAHRHRYGFWSPHVVLSEHPDPTGLAP